MKKMLLLALLLFLLLPALAWEYPSGWDRGVKLKGTRNTRDLGGIPVVGGVFPQGMVYRSGALCFASKGDARKLHGLGIKTMLELRLPNEIERDGPDKAYLLQGISKKRHWPMGNSYGIGQQAYRSYMEDNAELFRDFFALMSEKENYPVMYHCSAGKDRTGILTALLLESLGTPRSIILDDYLHSMRITPKLKVHETWLEETFAVVDQAGGIEAYLNSIGVTTAEIEEIRRLLCRR